VLSADQLHAELAVLVQDAAQPKKLSRLRQLFHLALLQQQPDLTLEDAGQIMTGLGGYLPALGAVASAINAAWPTASKDGEARPRKRAAKAGTG
jgi:hypothetical protein